MRASATWVDCTVLAPVTLTGLTMPEKRMNSLPWLMAICFSPDTSRLPLGSTSMTVVVMVPVKALLAAASPLPPNLLASEAAASSPLRPPRGSLASAVMEAARLALRSALADDFLLAAVCSTRLTVMMSPTKRARRSSNRGRVKLGW